MHRTILLGAIVTLLTATAITLSSKLPRLAAALETIVRQSSAATCNSSRAT